MKSEAFYTGLHIKEQETWNTNSICKWQEEEDGDEKAKEACAYGSDARNNPSLYF